MGADQTVVQLERPLVMPDRFFGLAGLGDGDGYVEENARVGGVVPESQPVRRERGLEVALPFQGQTLVEIVEALRPQRLPGLRAEQASPEAHGRTGISEQSRMGTISWLRAKIPLGGMCRNARRRGC